MRKHSNENRCVCQRCGAYMWIIDSRPCVDPNVVRRRRHKCEACDHRMTTHEVIVGVNDDVVTPSQKNALIFLHEMEKLVRAHFGTGPAGNLKSGTR